MAIVMVMALGASGCEAIDAGMRKAVQCDGVVKAINGHNSTAITSVATAERAAVGFSDLDRQLTALKLDDAELNKLVLEYTASLRALSDNLRAGLRGDELEEGAIDRHNDLVDSHDRHTRHIEAYCQQ